MAIVDDNLADVTQEKETNGFWRHLALRLLWLGLAVGLSVLAYAQLIRDDVLPIQQIKISGEFKQLHQQDFKALMTDDIKGNFFTVNVADIYQNLLALPWVEKAWIHRVWPNTIKINIQEQKPIGILKNVGLLNEHGYVFSDDSQGFENILPLFVVAENHAQDAVEQYKKNIAILDENELNSRVFYYDERKSQTIILSNGIKLVLGRMGVEKKLRHFVKAYKTHLQYEDRKIQQVDLRYTNGLAVSWEMIKDNRHKI